jgi:nitrate/TMAO reductase-like tetraheme cytochrome c subunit
MGKLRSTGRQFGRILKRVFKGVGLLVVVAGVVAVLGATAVWGHFWGARVGNPSSESCTSCHVMQPYADSLTTPNLLASAHANEGVECIDCHSDYGAEEQLRDTLAYVQNTYDEPFARVRYPMETCFQCHEHGSYDQIAWRTTDLGVTDPQAKGHDANPHQPPHYTDLECNSCHRVHRESTLLCWECHTYQYDSPYFGPEVEATATPAP